MAERYPFQNDITSSNLKRRLKSLTERMLYMGCNNIADNELILGVKCYVLSASNTIYGIDIWEWLGEIKCKCDCPDYSIRHLNCKHIYWLGFKKFGDHEPLNWKYQEYLKLIEESYILNTNVIGRNVDCPICLEDIDYGNETTINCVYQCQNSVHSICWLRYSEMSGKTNCVMCRNEFYN